MRPVLVVWALAVALLLAASVANPQATASVWSALGVIPMQPPQTFADSRVITAGWESVQAGLNPYESNPFDPWKRPFNYPPSWLWPLGAGAGATVPLALFTLTVFGLCAGRLLWSLPGWLQAAVLLSPPLLTAVERANNDLIVFAVVAAPVLWAPAALEGALVLATVLKLYPCAALAVTGRPRHALGAAAACAVWLWAARAALAQALAATPTALAWAYGGRVLIYRAALVARDFGFHPHLTECNVVMWVLLGLALLGAAVTSRPARPSLSFRVGAMIYLATFALNANWNYRLVFLLLCLPQLVAWGRAGRSGLALVLATLWLDRLWMVPWLWVVDELTSWVLFAWLAQVLCGWCRGSSVLSPGDRVF